MLLALFVIFAHILESTYQDFRSPLNLVSFFYAAIAILTACLIIIVGGYFLIKDHLIGDYLLFTGTIAMALIFFISPLWFIWYLSLFSIYYTFAHLPNVITDANMIINIVTDFFLFLQPSIYIWITFHLFLRAFKIFEKEIHHPDTEKNGD